MDLHFDENNDLSLKRFERMLKTNSIFFFDSAEFERIIGYYIDHGKVNLAKKAIELALDQHPDIVNIRVLKAELLIMEDKFSEALKLLDELVSLEPNNEEIYIQKALLNSKQDHHEEAILLLEWALTLSEENENIDILNLIGMEYLYLENFEKALEYFKICLSIEPEDQTTLYNTVYCYDMLDQSAEAILFLKSYIESEPYNETAWHQLGREYFVMEEYNKALEAFDYAILIDEKFVGAILEKAKTLEQLEHYFEAIQNYTLATELDDPTAYAYMRIGYCFEKLNNTQKAMEYYQKSSEQDPYLDKPLLGIIDILFQAKDFHKALFYINQLINLEDENPVYWRLYGQANLKIAFFEEASKAFQKCLHLNDNILDNHLDLADSFYHLGDFKAAIKALINAEVYFHNYADIQYRLSGLYFLMKSNDLGIKYLHDALLNNPAKYKNFQKLFPIVHNSKGIQNILARFRDANPSFE
jgi:tetratricopeptide (TPR) repeat protein